MTTYISNSFLVQVCSRKTIGIFQGGCNKMRWRSFTKGFSALQVKVRSSFTAMPGTSGACSHLVFADPAMLKSVDRFREPL